MTKKESNISKIKDIFLIIAILLISLIAAIVIISIPMGLTYILSLILSSNEGYLLMGLSVCICGGILIILIPIIIFLLISNKKNRINDIKKLFQKYKIFSIVVISIITFLEIAVGQRAYTYYKDIKEGPQESIMMDAVVKVRSSGKGHHSYITGYINDKKISLELTQDAISKVRRNKKYKMIKIKYYKNIKEAYYIDVYISYVDDK